MHHYVLHFCPKEKGKSEFMQTVEWPCQIFQGDIIHMKIIEGTSLNELDRFGVEDWLVDKIAHYFSNTWLNDRASLVILSPTERPLKHPK